jgi:hypothetical protein
MDDYSVCEKENIFTSFSNKFSRVSQIRDKYTSCHTLMTRPGPGYQGQSLTCRMNGNMKLKEISKVESLKLEFISV